MTEAAHGEPAQQGAADARRIIVDIAGLGLTFQTADAPVDDSVYRDPDWDVAAAHVMSPPFRARKHQAAPWRGLQAGMLQTTATNAAKIFNIYPRKGSISVGADADIAIWDTERERTISKDTHHQNVDFNIFEDMTVKGINTTTISQGKVVYHDGDVRRERGVGRYIERPTFAPYFAALERERAANAPSAVDRVSAAE